MSQLKRGVWTPEEDQYLIDAWGRGDRSGAIAKELNRPRKNVTDKISRLREKGMELATRNPQRIYTDEQRSLVGGLWDSGLTGPEICARLGVTANYVKAVLKSIRNKIDDGIERRRCERKERVTSVATIKDIVARHFSIPEGALLSLSRKSEFTKPRHIAMALAHDLTGLSLQAIAKFFNREDHTTVLNGLRVAREKYAEDFEALRELVLAAGEEITPAIKPAKESLLPPPPPQVPVEPRAEKFEPRKVYPARIITKSQPRMNVTGMLLGDPGFPSLRVSRGERSTCVE